MKQLFASFVFILATSLPALADDPSGIHLGTPIYGGTGCPNGTASAVLSPDATSLSILFDQYVVDAGGTTGKQLNRESCNVAIPVHVPQGLSVSVFQIDYRGFNSLPYGAYARFNVEYFFAGTQGPSYVKTFYGQLEDNYDINNSLVQSSIVWSPCGQDVVLRTNSSMIVQTNGTMDAAESTVDSVDLRSGLIYHLQWQTCE